MTFGVQAITLGRVRGAALLGQPLDLRVQVQLESSDDASASCFEAEVFHADAQADASRVHVQVEPGGAPHVRNVRVQSGSLVDEPMITLYLHTRCGQSTGRRYVLLADFPSEKVLAPLALPDLAPTPVVAAPAPLSVQTGAALAAAPMASPLKPSAEKAKPAAPAATGQSRLKLDPVETVTAQVPSPVAPTTAPNEDGLRDRQRLQTMEADMKALLALVARNKASLVDMKVRLQRAEAERFPMGLLYLLAALVGVCLAAVAWLWSRLAAKSAQHADWWSANPSGAAPLAPVQDEHQQGAMDLPLTQGAGLNTAPLQHSTTTRPSPLTGHDDTTLLEPDVTLVEMSESHFDKLMQTGTSQGVIRRPPHGPRPTASHSGARHSLSADLVFDIRQQAEFFVSLGQADQAVRILEKQINETDAPNPYVYLDLLAIFHALSLKADFRQYRNDFCRLFNVEVPEFAQFKNEGHDLEAYTAVLDTLTQAWASPQVLELLEKHLVRRDANAFAPSFDLAAFSDLLMLHAVAQGVARMPSISAAPASPLTSIGNVVNSATFSADSMKAGLSLATTSPDPGYHGAVLDLDLDLSAEPQQHDASAPRAAFQAAQPEAAGQGKTGEVAALDDSFLMDFELPRTQQAAADGGSKPHG